MKSIIPLGKMGFSGVRYHKGYVYDKLRHTVLTINQMSEADKRFVQATLKTIVTGPDAFVLPDGTNGWACSKLDLQGKSYVLSYRGIEVALFYKRQLHEIALQPGDRYPEGVCQDPKEAWMRLDFLGLSAEKANFVLGTEHKRLNEENKILKDRLQTLDDLNYQLEKENTQLKDRRKQDLSSKGKRNGKRKR